MPSEPQKTTDLKSRLHLLQDDLFILMLQKTINTDIRIERLLIDIRCELLYLISDGELPADLETRATRFLIALAQQCYLNEYVFAETEQETHSVNQLVETIGKRITTDKRLPLNEIALVCSYRALNRLPCAASITRYFKAGQDDPIYPLIRLQMINPLIEKDIYDSLREFTSIDPGMSLHVRQQYEENPYPRWQYMDYHTPIDASQWFQNHCPALKSRDLTISDNPIVLVAGCGTGRQAISAARRFANCQVTAVDLSRSSLAYGMRQALELGVDNIEFGHADILHIGDLDKQFDIVECVGVLHHMADPLAGFRSLLPMLKSGGFMRLGLYSAFGRRNIKLARAVVAEKNLGTKHADIRRFREIVLNQAPSSDLFQVTKASEFFSTSECRDLVMHVCEHLHDLPEISGWLAEGKLEFLGFEFYDDAVADDYRAQNPDDDFALDLDRWHSYEQSHPDMFASMYQFWAIKH